jgi:predicted dehydrogenase
VLFPGFRDIRGYQAMYRDFHRAIRAGGQPEMSLERAIEDQILMERVYATLAS